MMICALYFLVSMVMLLISVFSAVFRTRYGSGVKPSIAETAKEYIAIIIPTWQIDSCHMYNILILAGAFDSAWLLL